MVSPAGAKEITLQQWLKQRKQGNQPKATVKRTAPQKTVQTKNTAKKTAKKAAPRVAIQKITGPQYFTYAAPAITSVALASLLPDIETTGSIAAIAAQSGQIALPPMLVLSPDAPIAPAIEAPAAQAPAATTGGLSLPPMVLLDDAAPSLGAQPSPQVAVPAPTLLPAATPRLASSDYFALGTQNAPDKALRIEPEIADAVRDLYAARRDFMWSDGVDITDEAQAVAAMLNSAQNHGLVAQDYGVTLPVLPDDAAVRAQALVAFDVSMTAHAVRLAVDLKNGVVNPNKLSGYHDFKDERLTASTAAEALANQDAPAAWIAAQAPQQNDYRLLQAELAAQANAVDDSIDFPDDLLLKPGTTNEALPLVIKAIKRNLRAETRQAHQATLDSYTGSINYDEAIVALVRDVQRDLGLAPDGIVGPKTAARLGGESPQARIAKIKYAMERLRWHPEQYGARQVVINQPEFRVRYMENGKTELAMNVVVGTQQNQTYFFHDEIETVVFNPYWGVPQSIIVNEFLPKLHRDPGYLDRAGYVVSTYGGKQVSSSSVNWRQYSSGVPFNVRQKPGPKNALGELKILFPNEHAIYMHDTPAKNLFARDSRAYSHGCVRLEDPRAMAAAVLGKDVSYVRSQLGGYEHAERVSDKVPVYVGYFTAWPDDSGEIAYHADVYNRDEHLQKALSTVADARKG